MQFRGVIIENFELGGIVYGRKGAGIHAERVDGYAYGKTTDDPISLGDLFCSVVKYGFEDLTILDFGVQGTVSLVVKELKWRREVVLNVRPNQSFEMLLRGDGLETLAAVLNNTSDQHEIYLLPEGITRPVNSEQLPPNVRIVSIR